MARRGGNSAARGRQCLEGLQIICLIERDVSEPFNWSIERDVVEFFIWGRERERERCIKFPFAKRKLRFFVNFSHWGFLDVSLCSRKRRAFHNFQVFATCVFATRQTHYKPTYCDKFSVVLKNKHMTCIQNSLALTFFWRKSELLLFKVGYHVGSDSDFNYLLRSIFDSYSLLTF